MVKNNNLIGLRDSLSQSQLAIILYCFIYICCRMNIYGDSADVSVSLGHQESTLAKVM